MAKPTLLIKGSLISDDKKRQSHLDEIVPIEHILKIFGENLEKNSDPSNRVFIIEASTGSGKTTIIPPAIYAKYHNVIGRNIVITQPRVINAIQIPYNIIEFNPNLIIGENIGYQTGNIVKKPSKGILFTTVGLLLQQLSTLTDEQIMKKYSVVIIDEAHEMSIATELVLKFMKELIFRNYKDRRCPFLFVMSATFDPTKFAKYLLGNKIEPEENIIRVRGFTYPIEDKFLEVDTENYVQKSVEISLKLHEKLEDFDSDFRDILIFVSGAQEIKAILSEFEKTLNKGSKFLDLYPLKVIRLTGDIVREQSKEYRDIFAKYSKDMKRRIIIGTNVAETGITIDTLKYVIDTGFYKSKEYNPNLNAEILHYKNISNDMRMQRRGRVGRKNPGVYYGLYTKDNVDILEKIAPQNLPEMYKTDISLELITALSSFDDLDLLNPIPSQLFESTLEKLFYLGLIDVNKKPTELGLAARKFRFLSIESVKMILSTTNWDYSNIVRVVNMAAIIETLSLDRQTDRTALYKDFYGEKFLYYQTLHSCDFILLTLIFEKYQQKIEKNSDLKFLTKIGMEKKEKAFIEALKIRDETIFTLNKMGININKEITYETINTQEEVEKIKRIIYEGYKLNVIYGGNTYKNVPILNKTPQYFGTKYIVYKKIRYTEMQRKYYATAETLSNFDGISIDYQIFSR